MTSIHMSNHVGATVPTAPENASSKHSIGVLGHTQEAMPHPGNIYDSRWKPLSMHLQNCTLSRFDQDKCTHNHGISERAMCAGLSISWLKMVHGGDNDASLRHSIGRMSHLASFEGVVGARTAHNYYRTEHSFQFDRSSGAAQILGCGNDSLIDAAHEMTGLDLKTRLSDGQIPFQPLIHLGQNQETDHAALDKVTEAVKEAGQGVYVVFCGDSSHAMAFSKVPDSDDIMIFDPNHGEFKTTLSDFHTTIDHLSAASNMKPLFAQVFSE